MTVGLDCLSAHKHKGAYNEVDIPWDVRAVFRSGPEAELEDEETEHRDRTVTVACVLGEEEAYINVLRFLTFRTEDVTNAGQLEAERRAEDDAQECEPAHGESYVSWQLVERRLDAWYPDRLHWACHNGVWDESESDDAGKKAD